MAMFLSKRITVKRNDAYHGTEENRMFFLHIINEMELPRNCQLGIKVGRLFSD